MNAANTALLLGAAGFTLLAYAVHGWLELRHEQAQLRRVQAAKARVTHRPAAPEEAFLVGDEPLDDPRPAIDTQPGTNEQALAFCEALWAHELGER